MIKSRWALVGAALVLSLLGAACGESPLVIQGTVVSYDTATKVLVMLDEQAPEQQTMLQLATADVGSDPIAGDIVRIAYRKSPEGLVALRVMNLSHQIH